MKQTLIKFGSDLIVYIPWFMITIGSDLIFLLSTHYFEYFSGKSLDEASYSKFDREMALLTNFALVKQLNLS